MFPQFDFLSLWAAGRQALLGRNPYDELLIIDELVRSGVPLIAHQGGFHNPPWSLFIFVPFSLFPLPVAEFLWFALAIAVFLLCAQIYFRAYQEEQDLGQKAAWPRALFAIFTFYPVQKHLLFGQSTHIALLGLLLFLLYTKQNKYFIAGISLALTFIKPHLFLALYAFVFIRFCLKRNTVLFLGIFTGWILQTLVSFAIAPQAFSGYVSYLARFYSERTLNTQVTLGHILSAVTGKPFWVWAIVALGLLAAVILSFSRIELHRSIIQLCIPISLITAPYAWSHDHILLLPFLLSMSFAAYKISLNRTRLLLLLSSIFCWAVVVSDFPKSEKYMVVIPFVFLLYAVVNHLNPYILKRPPELTS